MSRRWQRRSRRRGRLCEGAARIVRGAGLREAAGGFLFESCNDQGAPPYGGRVAMSFAVPAGAEPEQHFSQIAAAMVRQGWTAGAPAGERPFGGVVHTEAVMAIMGRACGDAARGSAQVRGECRNVTDHRHDGKTVGVEISEQLSGS